MDDPTGSLYRTAMNRHRSLRRRATRRSRKLGALVVGLAIAIAGIGTALVAFSDEPPNRAVGDPAVDAWTPPDVLTVWPENPLTDESSEEVQAAVDAGDPDLRWRTDPDAVVERFAAEVLGWTPKFMLRDARQRGQLQGVISPCGDVAVCGSLPVDNETAWLRLVQPARIGAGGVWSVAAFVSRPLVVGTSEPHREWDVLRIPPGDRLPFDLRIPPGTDAHIGVVVTNGCRSFRELLPGQSAGMHAVRLPEASTDAACGDLSVGYGFAYVQDASTVPVGDPLLEAASFVYPWLTIVPLAIDGGTETGANETSGE